MKISDLKNKKIVIWGAGREGLAAAAFIRSHLSEQKIIFVDEGDTKNAEYTIIHDLALIAQTIADADIVIKSPGVSLYHPFLIKENARGLVVTSLLNIWCAENPKARIIAVTGTKGKSTTASLLHHVLINMGEKAVLLGNIGVPVTEATEHDAEYFIIEVSSYQAANFTGQCEIGIMTSLFPEHLDWHGGEKNYYKNKANLLLKSKIAIIEEKAACLLKDLKLFQGLNAIIINQTETQLGNSYLDRAHNRSNVNAVLAVVQALNLDNAKALHAMKNFQGLPHRQQELGETDGILYVDDSISTTPQSAIAALETYKGRAVTLIAGGHNRGIDFQPLIKYIIINKINAVICLGTCGPIIFDALKAQGMKNTHLVTSMQAAVEKAKASTARKILRGESGGKEPQRENTPVDRWVVWYPGQPRTY